MDFINFCFQLLVAGGLIFSIRECWKEQKALGVHWAMLPVPMVWSVFDLFYYPHLEQYWSFVGAIILMGANITYLYSLFKFSVNSPLKNTKFHISQKNK